MMVVVAIKGRCLFWEAFYLWGSEEGFVLGRSGFLFCCGWTTRNGCVCVCVCVRAAQIGLWALWGLCGRRNSWWTWKRTLWLSVAAAAVTAAGRGAVDVELEGFVCWETDCSSRVCVERGIRVGDWEEVVWETGLLMWEDDVILVRKQFFAWFSCTEKTLCVFEVSLLPSGEGGRSNFVCFWRNCGEGGVPAAAGKGWGSCEKKMQSD
jgi:hypothetical protein